MEISEFASIKLYLNQASQQSYLQHSKRTDKFLQVTDMGVVYAHICPAIDIESKQKQFQNEQEQSSVHAECRLPLDVIVGFDGCNEVKK